MSKASSRRVLYPLEANECAPGDVVIYDTAPHMIECIIHGDAHDGDVLIDFTDGCQRRYREGETVEVVYDA